MEGGRGGEEAGIVGGDREGERLHDLRVAVINLRGRVGHALRGRGADEMGAVERPAEKRRVVVGLPIEEEGKGPAEQVRAAVGRATVVRKRDGEDGIGIPCGSRVREVQRPRAAAGRVGDRRRAIQDAVEIFIHGD